MSDDKQGLLFGENTEPAKLYPAAFLRDGAEQLLLNAVEIDGLKGFDRTRIELRKLSILTGPNNSGKSTILQAIALGFECFRRLIDPKRMILQDTGRSISEFEFLPVNQPKDLWFETTWKPTRKNERYVRIRIDLDQDVSFAVRIRYLYGVLNIGLEKEHRVSDPQLVRKIANSIPVLVPSSPGPDPHEERYSLAQIHRIVSINQPTRVLRNILLEMQHDGMTDELDYLRHVCQKYFGVRLSKITYDDKIDLEIRSEVAHQKYKLDVVSEGSGFNQILLLATIISWRKPSILLLDEPDAHLHPSLQRHLLSFLMELVAKYGLQVIISTHSKDLIGQAPISSIIPVDRERSELVPLRSMEHLLLEYQRQGSVTNVDLALLYQSKRCLFVEGSTDIKILTTLAEQMNIDLFNGTRQIVLFAFAGVDKLKYLPELVRLFEKIVGSRLNWGVLRDSDANVPEVIDKIREEVDGKIENLNIWSKYTLENYLIHPEYLTAALKSLDPDLSVTQADLDSIVINALEDLQDEVSSLYITKAQMAYRQYEMAERHMEEGARVASKYLRELDTMEKKIDRWPGKKMFGAIVGKIQMKYSVDLRLEDILSVIGTDNCPDEILTVLNELTKLRS